MVVLRVGLEGLEEVVEMLERDAEFGPVMALEYVPDAHPGDHVNAVVLRVSEKRGERAEEVLPGTQPLRARLVAAAVAAQVLVDGGDDPLHDAVCGFDCEVHVLPGAHRHGILGETQDHVHVAVDVEGTLDFLAIPGES